MASKKSDKYPYRWSNGSYHSRPENKPAPKPATPPSGPGYGIGGNTNLGAWGRKLTPAERATIEDNVPTFSPPAPPPPDPYLEAQRTSAQRNLAVGNAAAAYQTGQIKQEYGLEDKSDPYSRAAQLEESYRRSKLGTTNSYAGAGKLHTGLYGVQQGENQRNYNIGYDQLSRSYNNALQNVQLGQLQNTANYGIGVDDASFQALLRAFTGG